MKGSKHKFGFIHSLLIFLSIEDINGLLFFHENSYVELYSPGTKADFGFSIAYQDELKNLIVGEPHSKLDGKVYTCPLEEAVKQKKLACNSIDIDIDKLAGNYNRNYSKDQGFCLGASVSVTPDYIFTCAPLWSSFILDGDSEKFGALGTCFISKGTYASRYNGLLEQYVQNPSMRTPKNVNKIYGGMGWNTLYDPVNKLILIAKPALYGSIIVMNASNPLETTSSVDLNVELSSYYLQGSLAAGIFFNNNNTLYAFSMTSISIYTGRIAFLYYDTSDKLVKVLRGSKGATIEDESINSMYGASLHSVDINGDAYSELLVGAPAQSFDAMVYEHGAVHFYLGGGKAGLINNDDLCVYGVGHGSRFGTAVGSTDIDGDGLPEIFISAPYEKEKGAVYVLSGYMITKLLQNKAVKSINVTDLSDMQRIGNVPYTSFGFSLLPIRDFYANGESLLAVGSTGDGKVALFRSIPFINVTVTAVLAGMERVKEDDTNFTVTVSVTVSFPPKANDISGKLIVSTNIIGDPARIENGIYTIDITPKKTLYEKDILVLLEGTDPSTYKFKVKVDSDVKRFDKQDFDKSFFTISDYSKSENVLDVARRCKEKVCVPRLSMSFNFNSMLGSRASENVTFTVRNDGNITYDSCARIYVTGVKATIAECIQTEENWFKCDLINIDRHEERYIDITLDMSKATNRDNRVDIQAYLYNTCGGKETKNTSLTIPFKLNTSEITIDHVSFDRNVTLTEIQDTETSPTIDVRELFTITNNGSVMWTFLPVKIYLEMESYLDDIIIIPEAGDCKEISPENKTLHNCIVNLEPNSTFKITITRRLIKDKIMDVFNIKEKITMNSTYTLSLEPTSTILNKSFSTTLYFQIDTSFGSNKYYIIAVAVLLALFVLVVIIIILYKVGFFERKEKNKLAELKEEIKQKSIRRPNRDDAAATLQDNNQVTEGFFHHVMTT